MRLRTATLLAVVGALALGTAGPAAATETGTASWAPDLVAGESAGVTVDGGTARLDHAGTHLLPDDDGAPVPTGLLTLPTHPLEMRTDRVDVAVDGDLPEGSTAAVDVRGRRASGGWTEWVPATSGTAALPEPTSEVQTRLVLTGDPAAEPAVRGVTVTAHPATARTEAVVESAALNYRVFATREGLAGGTTANGHVIAERDHFVALPSRRALAPRNTSDYSVKVCAPNGRCAFAPVWDVGPWNTRDDYWNPSDQRQEWKDLPQGVPQAQAAHADGYNGGRDQFGRTPSNPAGIDLGDGLFWDALGLTDNAWVTVDYLWTGSVRLSLVSSDSPVDVLAAPDSGAEVVGVAAESAAVPVECALSAASGTWLRIGTDQYIEADEVTDAEGVASCDTAPATTDAPVAGDSATPADATTATSCADAGTDATSTAADAASADATPTGTPTSDTSTDATAAAPADGATADAATTTTDTSTADATPTGTPSADPTPTGTPSADPTSATGAATSSATPAATPCDTTGATTTPEVPAPTTTPSTTPDAPLG
ncbi:hypothetical protein ACFFTK_06675 [Pseudonocardia petroleophila]|uniref:Uncharacterized protein n=1 Tax=Pseudonocardia petroleophila TaxID=37331 RepID=A0A7G7MNS3_9PSEU|nr:hypothetical protein [Pseudonocardia petroleophila]QNG54434.1 hypothetical protein H6H00_11400 [Pseudonocardia petroleophila]